MSGAIIFLTHASPESFIGNQKLNALRECPGAARRKQKPVAESGSALTCFEHGRRDRINTWPTQRIVKEPHGVADRRPGRPRVRSVNADEPGTGCRGQMAGAGIVGCHAARRLKQRAADTQVDAGQANGLRPPCQRCGFLAGTGADYSRDASRRKRFCELLETWPDFTILPVVGAGKRTEHNEGVGSKSVASQKLLRPRPLGRARSPAQSSGKRFFGAQKAAGQMPVRMGGMGKNPAAIGMMK